MNRSSGTKLMNKCQMQCSSNSGVNMDNLSQSDVTMTNSVLVPDFCLGTEVRVGCVCLIRSP